MGLDQSEAYLGLTPQALCFRLLSRLIAKMIAGKQKFARLLRRGGAETFFRKGR